MTQIQMGMDVEEEHLDTYNWLEEYFKKNKKMPNREDFYKSIVEDHLKEFDDYYTRLMKANL
jgi:hypothetical protein